jgi:predicted nucleotidyltransferase
MAVVAVGGVSADIASMGITAEQASAIKDWAKATKHVGEVRLYGSQATGLATDTSDIDLAITIAGADPGNTVLGIYVRFADEWQHELGQLVGSKVHVGLYNDDENSTGIVRRSCDECSELLFP